MLDKKLLLRAKKLLIETRTPEELYGLSHITNMYIGTPNDTHKELLEIYCDMVDSVNELDSDYKKFTK